MKSYKIAIFPGDGIGPEVVAQARRILAETCRLFGFHCEVEEGLLGQSALDATGKLLPPETIQLARGAQAVLLGPVGGPIAPIQDELRQPKEAVVKLQGWLGTHTTIRPIKSYAAMARITPLKDEFQAIDMVLVHDHASGLPYGTPRGRATQDEAPMATNTLIYTAPEIRRVAEIAFEVAAERQGRVVLVDLAQMLETGELWRDTVQAVAATHPEVTLTRADADNFMFNMVRHPHAFDVVLTESTLGPLMAFAAAGLTGTYAIHPKAYVGGTTSIFQPSHGAALDIAGRGVANPIATIRAVAMMLDHAFEQEQDAAAAAIEQAVAAVLSEGVLPAEMSPSGGTGQSTAAIGDAVIAALRRIVEGPPVTFLPDEAGHEVS